MSQIVKSQIETILNYLEQFLPLANCHMVDYFTKNTYNTYIPKEMRNEIQKFGKENTINAIFSDNTENYLPHLNKFIEKSRELTLKNCKNICLDTATFQEKLKDLGCEEFLRLKLEMFMSSKKSHEVEVLSCIAASVRNIAKTSHVIDIGDGKGYLSSMLALHYKIPVLGVDAKEINTSGAIDRVRRLSKIWNSVVSKEKHKDTSANLYKQVTQYVNEKVNFHELISNVFLEEPKGLSLVGLHTCGNLASSSLRIFNSSEHIQTICNVGCCYHLIDELFENNSNVNSPEYGFPVSDFLQRKRCVIGRPARMMAAQSVDRLFDKKELPNKSIFYRALFEVFIENVDKDMPLKNRHVGRFRKECTSFQDYVQKASKRVNLNIDGVVSETEIDDLHEKYKTRINELNVFYLIRSMLSPVIESLILLDRLLFLYENGHEKSFLVQLFDPVVSPRCYGLIAFK